LSSLRPAFENQDQRFSYGWSILREAMAARVFPAASVAVTHKGKLVAVKALGHFTYRSYPEGDPSLSRSLRQSGDFDSLVVTPSTLFDLASLTKVLATTPMAMLLYERGLLDLEAPIIGAVPEFLVDSYGQADPRRRDVTYRMLLAHSSGLPAYEKLFLNSHSREELLHAAFTMALSADPASRAGYSDIGFIILGVALERIAGEPLDVFCQREIFGPLAMRHTTFNPPPEMRAQIPPTADEREECGARALARELPSRTSPASGNQRPSTFRDRIIQGEVQDENASVLEGVAGHAGLFSTAGDVALFAHAMLRGGQPVFRPETVALFTRRESAPPGTSRALGWDTPSTPSQSGQHFGVRSYGHLGYTGTSLWIDPDRQLSITLLTNRTWPDCSNQAIKQIRPRFHDAIVQALT
jgi:CubicO group peptidase (beta-lactamase class C family)